MISGSLVVAVLVWIVIIGLIAGLLNWLLDYIALAEPFNKAARVVLAIVAIVLIINQLLVLIGVPIIK